MNCHISPRRSPRHLDSQKKNKRNSLKSPSELKERKSQEKESPEYPISVGGRSRKSGTPSTQKLLSDDSLIAQETPVPNVEVVPNNFSPNKNNTNISPNPQN